MGGHQPAYLTRAIRRGWRSIKFMQAGARWQAGKTYNGTACRTIRNLNSAAVCPYDRINKSKSKAVSQRMLSLDETLKSSANISGGNPGPLSSITSSADPCANAVECEPASRRKVSQLIFKQIA